MGEPLLCAELGARVRGSRLLRGCRTRPQPSTTLLVVVCAGSGVHPLAADHLGGRACSGQPHRTCAHMAVHSVRRGLRRVSVVLHRRDSLIATVRLLRYANETVGVRCRFAHCPCAAKAPHRKDDPCDPRLVGHHRNRRLRHRTRCTRRFSRLLRAVAGHLHCGSHRVRPWRLAGRTDASALR